MRFRISIPSAESVRGGEGSELPGQLERYVPREFVRLGSKDLKLHREVGLRQLVMSAVLPQPASPSTHTT